MIARPRRFGKTLNIDMLNCFFSNEYVNREDLFEGLSIWDEEKYREIQGTYPVISLSFAGVKETTYEETILKIIELLKSLFVNYSFLAQSEKLHESERAYVNKMAVSMSDFDAKGALHKLSELLCKHYEKKVIILLDEYDTPMQEAYVNGFWEKMVAFTRSMFNSVFKTNPYMERAIMIGITRVGAEPFFSDLNLQIVTTTSNKYVTAFGFTEEEVFVALDEYGLSDERKRVKRWYDGFIFGKQTNIYNPWSILNFLAKGKYNTDWIDTSSNNLVGKLIREGNGEVKTQFEELLQGKHLRMPIDEQIVYNQLDDNEAAIWSLLFASGYLKVLDYEHLDKIEPGTEPLYELTLTNGEVRYMFEEMVRGWFTKAKSSYNRFIKAMFLQDIDAMNEYMNRIALTTFSYFDTGNRPTGQEPERFYHGFVLGLMVDLRTDYIITSNRESGFGRYDVVLEPKNPEKNPAVIIEFKVRNPRREQSLEETVATAFNQIEEQRYDAELLERGIPAESIYKYGYAFEGKTVLIGSSNLRGLIF